MPDAGQGRDESGSQRIRYFDLLVEAGSRRRGGSRDPVGMLSHYRQAVPIGCQRRNRRSIGYSRTRTELVALVERLHRATGKAVLIERYLDGREFNVALLEERGDVRVLPPAEILFKAYPPGKPKIVDYAAKWLEDSFEYRNTERQIPAQVSSTELEQIRELAVGSWKACGCRDYARVDLRMDGDGRCWVGGECQSRHCPGRRLRSRSRGRRGRLRAVHRDSPGQCPFTSVHRVEPYESRREGRIQCLRTVSSGPLPTRLTRSWHWSVKTGFSDPTKSKSRQKLESAVNRGDYESYTFRSAELPQVGSVLAQRPVR